MVFTFARFFRYIIKAGILNHRGGGSPLLLLKQRLLKLLKSRKCIPMIDLTFCYPSNANEKTGTELLYSPLALSYMASHTPDYYNKKLVDEYVGEPMDPDHIQSDLVAMSPLTPGVTRAYKLADRLRERGITCVIGGAHASALPQEALQHFDAVIIGEGETPWQEFLEDFEKGDINKTYFGPMNVPLDDLHPPDRDFIHPNYDFPSVLTSRGCPYHCSFCYLTVYRKKSFRMMPHDTIMADLERVKDNFAIIFTDENFMGYTEETVENRKILLEKMIRRDDFNFYWGCQTTAKLSKEPELMDLMYRAGCRAVFIGFESLDQDSLQEVNKQHNIGMNYKEAVEKIHDHNIAVIASTILGMDSHKKNYHKKLLKDLKEIKADYARVFLMGAWPGTPLYKKLEEEGRVGDNWDQFRQDTPNIEFKHYTHEEIVKARKEVMDGFFSFTHILRIIGRWLFRDRTLIGVFLRMMWRMMFSERIRYNRALEFAQNEGEQQKEIQKFSKKKPWAIQLAKVNDKQEAYKINQKYQKEGWTTYVAQQSTENSDTKIFAVLYTAKKKLGKARKLKHELEEENNLSDLEVVNYSQFYAAPLGKTGS